MSVPRDLAYIYALRGDFASARRALELPLALAEQMQNGTQHSFTLAMRGWITALAGDLQDARTDINQALAVSRHVKRSWHSTYLPIFLARISLIEGALAPASGYCREALALAEAGGDLQALRWAATSLAETEILEGRPEAAQERLLPLLDRPGQEACDVTLLLPVLAWAHLELGQTDEAARTVERALARARPEGMRLVLVEVLRVQALIALRRGEPDQAAASLEEGMALARAMPYPHAEARFKQIAEQLRATQVR